LQFYVISVEVIDEGQQLCAITLCLYFTLH
jgi:hypothetical protein